MTKLIDEKNNGVKSNTPLHIQVKSTSPQDTFNLGAKLGGMLLNGFSSGLESSLARGEGQVVLLYGDLGAGKTELVKGIASGLGIDPAIVSSPTFSIVNEYKVPCDSDSEDNAIQVMYHFDCYRIDENAWFEQGFDEYIMPSAISVLEWSENIVAHEDLSQQDVFSSCIAIKIGGNGDDPREIDVRVVNG
ncbi:MAG: tRNA (adenosine(37)-N6)-threonylcarbamoyltransferase complex ATPase subunit type 1 TsaE [Clostridiales bacterium]|jgi:tRNA threonylcarbamoyladenosine biosynthesis protein TsaE|nr:tRNA (adenosine(37)-N6)-threonylcarbamoyltransferase complex ATPase subunit type 1 TsaE [Clostridiales bacterium]